MTKLCSNIRAISSISRNICITRQAQSFPFKIFHYIQRHASLAIYFYTGVIAISLSYSSQQNEVGLATYISMMAKYNMTKVM